MTEEQKEKQRIRRRQWYLKNKAAHNLGSIDWSKKNPEKAKLYNKRSKLRKAYGITEEQLKELLERQKNKCCVCGKTFGKTRMSGPNIDHCHVTKVIRGILCGYCNAAEGFLRTPDTARKLYEYMLRNELFYQGRN